MVNASHAVTTDKAHLKTGAEKAGEKVVEKRRALGRGLDSLLPGPRVVAPPAPAAAPSAGLSAAIPVPAPSAAATLTPTISPAGEAGAGAPAPSSFSASPAVPALVGEMRASGETADGELVYRLALDLIDNNPYQTRRSFNEAALEELANSIRMQGVIQPIVVRQGTDGHYKLILGERRVRASRIAGMETIPAIVKRVSEQQAAEMTIVENLQRQDLNCMEQARAFAELSKDFQLTQEQIGQRVGLSRGAVSNYMRLLDLPSGVQEALWLGKLTFSHARLFLPLRNEVQIWSLAKKTMEQKMSVEQLEAVMMGIPKPGKDPNKGGARWVDPNVKAAQRSLEEILGMRVRIRDRVGRGRILIDYNSIEDFERVVGMLRGKQ